MAASYDPLQYAMQEFTATLFPEVAKVMSLSLRGKSIRGGSEHFLLLKDLFQDHQQRGPRGHAPRASLSPQQVVKGVAGD